MMGNQRSRHSRRSSKQGAAAGAAHLRPTANSVGCSAEVVPPTSARAAAVSRLAGGTIVTERGVVAVRRMVVLVPISTPGCTWVSWKASGAGGGPSATGPITSLVAVSATLVAPTRVAVTENWKKPPARTSSGGRPGRARKGSAAVPEPLATVNSSLLSSSTSWSSAPGRWLCTLTNHSSWEAPALEGRVKASVAPWPGLPRTHCISGLASCCRACTSAGRGAGGGGAGGRLSGAAAGRPLRGA